MCPPLSRLDNIYVSLYVCLNFFVYLDPPGSMQSAWILPISCVPLLILQRWLNELEIVWYEGKQNLNWNAILKQIRDDPQGFVDEGGFDMFLGDDGVSGEEGDSDEDDDDEEYAESGSEVSYRKEGRQAQHTRCQCHLFVSKYFGTLNIIFSSVC